MDADGNVTLTGRLKDVINRGGVKYNPQEVELLVESLPEVLRSAIAPVPDDRLGERACCYVVPRPGATVTLEAICDLPPRQGPRQVQAPGAPGDSRGDAGHPDPQGNQGPSPAPGAVSAKQLRYQPLRGTMPSRPRTAHSICDKPVFRRVVKRRRHSTGPG